VRQSGGPEKLGRPASTENEHPAEKHDCPWYASPSKCVTFLFVLVLSSALGTPLGLFVVELFDGFLDGRGFQSLTAMQGVGSILGLGYLYFDIILPACRYSQWKVRTCFAAGKAWMGALRVWDRSKGEVE
jgi:hypothetical protein